MDSRRENELNAVVTRYFQAKEKGESFDSEVVLRQHPDLADDLRSFFAAQSQVAKAAEHLKQNYDPTTATIGADNGPMPAVVRYFGDYELLEEIARGGMGVVYKARQVSLDRTVALKMILAGQLASKGDVQRFRQEAQSAANLDHPNILPIYEVGEHNGQQYFSMKLVEGGNLSSRIAALKEDPKAAAALMATLARAVHYAHQHGILHRDLKPANILLDKDGTPYVTDFGLAKKVQGESSVTQSGALVGTPSYMPPEQAKGAKDISTAADVYSLGAILYELLTGRPPFKGDSVFATVKQVMETEASEPRGLNPHADRDLSVIAMKCLRKDPADRYHSAIELADDLDRWRRREAILARPVGRMERAGMWVRRNPVVTGLGMALGLALFAGTLVSLAYASRAKTRAAQAELSELQKTLAYEDVTKFSTALQESLGAERHASYFAKVNLAFNEWQLNNPVRADRLLEETEPSERGWEFAFLRRLMHPERYTQDVDGRGLAVFAYSPDGRKIVTAGFDERIRIWNAADGKLDLTIVGHTSPVLSVAFSSDGRKMLASSAKDIILWDFATGKRLPWNGPADGASRLAWHADGRLAITLKGKQIAFFAPGSEKSSWTAPGTTVAWVEGGLVAACTENRVALYDPATGKETAALNADAPLKQAVPSADGKRLAVSHGVDLSGAGNDRVIVWDVSARKKLFDQKVMGFELALDAAGKTLAVGGTREVRSWNVDGGQEKPKLRGLADAVHYLAFAPDGSSFAAGTANLLTGAMLKEDPHDEGVAFAMAFLGAVTDNSSARMAVYDLPLPQFGSPLSTGQDAVSGLAVGPNGSVAIGRPEAVEIWNAASRRRELSIPVPKDAANVVALAPDGLRVLAGGKDKIVRSFDAATGKPLRHSLTQPGEISVLAPLPDNCTVAVASSGEGSLTLWDYTTGQTKAVAFTDSAGQAFTAVGRKTPLLVRSSTGGVNISNEAATRNKGVVSAIDPETGLKAKDFDATRGFVRSLALSTDDRTLAVISGDKAGGEAIQFFDTASGKETHHFPGDSEMAVALAYTPDGKRLVVSTDGSIKFLDAATGQLLLTIPQSANKLRFDSEGTRLLAVQGNQIVAYETSPPSEHRPLPKEEKRAGNDPPLPWEAEDDSFPKESRDLLTKAEKLAEAKDVPAALLYALRAAEKDPDPSRADHYRRSVSLYRQAAPLAGGTDPIVALSPLLPAKPTLKQCETRFGPGGTLIHTPCTFTGPPHFIDIAKLKTGAKVGAEITTDAAFFQEERNHTASTPDGKRIFAYLTVQRKKPMERWIEGFDVETGKSFRKIELPSWDEPRWQNGDTWISVTGDGRFVVFDELRPGTLPEDKEHFPGRTRAWDADTGKELELPQKFHRLAFSPDGRFVLATWLRSLAVKDEAEHPCRIFDLSTMKPVGAPIPLPAKVDYLELSLGGKYVVAREPGRGGQTLRAYTVADGRCTLAVKYQEAGLPYKLLPDGERIVVPGGDYKGKSVIEVRETATGKRKYTGTTLPSKPRHMEASPDGKFLLIVMWDGVQLVDTDLVEPVGPPLKVTSSHGDNRPMVADRNVAFLDADTFVVRAPYVKENYLKQTRFQVFDLKPMAFDPAEEKRRAELIAGRTINAEGELEAFPPEDYRKLWTAAKPEWKAADAKEPDKVPGAPLVAGKAPPKPPRPKQTPDYAAVFAKHGGAEQPPLVSIADAIKGASQANRMAAIKYLVFSQPDAPLTLDVLMEGLKDEGCRKEVLPILEKIGDKARPVVDRLLQEFELEIKHGDLEKPLVRALGKIGSAAKGAVPGLRDYIKSFGPNSYSDVEEEAIRTLGRIGPAAKDSLPDVAAKLSKYRRERGGAIVQKAIERIAEGRYDALVPVLETMLKPGKEEDGDWRKSGRELALEYIASVGPPLKDIGPAVRAVMAEPLPKNVQAEYGVKISAANALWKVTGSAEEALPALEAELKRPASGWPTSSITAAGRAAEVLGRMGEPAKKFLPAIEELLKKPRNLHDRIALAEAVWRLGGKPEELLAACQTRLERKEGYGGEDADKLATIVLLGELGPAAKGLVSLLQQCVKDEADADAKKVFRMTIIRTDDEDPDPNTGSQFRDAVKAVLGRIEAGAVKE